MPQTNITDRASNPNATRLTVVREPEPPSTREMLESVRAQLLRIEQQLAQDQARMGRAARVGAPEILACLKQAGHMSAAEILKAVPIAKSSLWLHLNALEREGKVWFRVTHAGQGGRKVTEIYHADAIVT